MEPETHFYDTLYKAVKLLNKTDVPRKALIVFTDGKDEGSSVEINDVIESARNSHVPVYCVTFNPQNRIKLLSRLTLLTDGKLYNSDKRDISSIYKSIIRTIKSQYHVEYKSMLKPDGKTHTVEARLKYEKLKDKDQVNITLKEPSMFFGFLLTQESILIAIIIILIIILIIFVICILLKLHKVNKVPAAVQKSVTSNGFYTEESGLNTAIKDNPEEKKDDGQGKNRRADTHKCMACGERRC